MRGHYTILRLLLAGFLLYVAWPSIPYASTVMEQIFWAAWIGFFLFVVGANVASLLQMIKPPIMEQQEERQRQTYNH
ncbi:MULTISPECIES: hypothetical protein [Virgibacillus]|uniref:Uncharacterized protein n=2 Tax=Virgibacillus TaxID=84406 RepID=A0A024QAS4_9BACI|nr:MULTISPECIES: hypothetical protein [Virgibacillus]EQB35712.1 hypothetical protein M948_11765 [Virgibacillus sp. CM-4]MYL41515.1 hypothetical protein [Virgibacillus massiliensis]GGJ50325.1 hypothetical protein GCM10007111_10680 [Virgibacillus kapii]CDQ39320.1 hypothetical protein BN990_01615 [Virgibacillus massiliensis]